MNSVPTDDDGDEVVLFVAPNGETWLASLRCVDDEIIEWLERRHLVRSCALTSRHSAGAA